MRSYKWGFEEFEFKINFGRINPKLQQPIAGLQAVPESKVHGANMEPIWGRQDPGGPHIGPMNFAIWGDFMGLLTTGP